MPACSVCGSDLPGHAKSCPVCGSSCDEAAASRRCPACSATYSDDHHDSFCVCGAALVADGEAAEVDLVAAGPADVGLIPVSPGVARLVVYSADRQPLHTFALDRDVVTVGRDDPVRGDFVELDVGRLFDEAVARKVSRRHCLVLRSRQDGTFVLRPLAGNTGTQVGGALAEEMTDLVLEDGARVVLGGVVRMKFVRG